jgi:hypothetical protein
MRVDATTASDTYTFATKTAFYETKKSTYIFTTAGGIGAPAIKLSKADWMAFQFHFFEWMYSYGGVVPITAATVTPGFYGDYATFFPSPSASTNFPDSTNNIGWASTNKEHFVTNVATTLPGSVGPIKYYSKDLSSFQGEANAY